MYTQIHIPSPQTPESRVARSARSSAPPRAGPPRLSPTALPATQPRLRGSPRGPETRQIPPLASEP